MGMGGGGGGQFVSSSSSSSRGSHPCASLLTEISTLSASGGPGESGRWRVRKGALLTACPHGLTWNETYFGRLLDRAPPKGRREAVVWGGRGSAVAPRWRWVSGGQRGRYFSTHFTTTLSSTVVGCSAGWGVAISHELPPTTRAPDSLGATMSMRLGS